MAMTSYQYLDELLREYLLFRGFTGTLKSFETDIKNEKEKGFRVDKIVEQINQSITTHDVNSLIELWKHFETKLFCRLETHRLAAVRKLENSLYKLYAVSCVQSKQTDKLREFYEWMTGELHGQAEWKDWFALPYIKDPGDNPAFSLYFSRQWQDTLIMSLSNFLSIVFQSLPPPRLADYQKTASRLRVMRDEIRRLKLKLASAELDQDPSLSQGNIKSLQPPPARENMDDFFLIAQETAVVDQQVRSLKSFLRNITGGVGGGGQADKKKSPSTKSRSSSKSRHVMQVSAAGAAVSQSVPGPGRQQQLRLKQPQSSVKSAELPVVVCSNTPHPDTARPEPEQEPGPDKPAQEEAGAAGGLPSRYLLLGQESYCEHRGRVSLLSVSPLSSNIASVDTSGVIKVWSPAPAPATIATFISGSQVTAVCWVEASDKFLLYGTSAGNLLTLKLRTIISIVCLGHVRLCDTQEKTAVAEVGGELLSGQPVAVLRAGPGPATFLLCAGIKILVMDTATCSLDRDLSHPGLQPVVAAVFNHNGSVLLHAGVDGRLGMTDLHRGELLGVWLAHPAPVTSLALNADQTGVWSLAEDGSLVFSSIIRSNNNKVWEGSLPRGDNTKEDAGKKTVFCLSSDSDHILVNGGGGAASILRLPRPEAGAERGGRLEQVAELGPGGSCGRVSSILWSTGDCSPAITGHEDGTINIYTMLAQ